MPTQKPKRKFRVYLSQVNQTYIEVSADSVEQAHSKAIMKGQRENKPTVMDTYELNYFSAHIDNALKPSQVKKNEKAVANAAGR